MRSAVLAVLLTLLPVVVQAEISFERLAQLSSMPVELQGRFRQEKYLGALDTSLLSSGRFSYRRDELIRWQIEQPIENELLMTPTGLSSRQGDDELLRLDADSNPGVTIMSEILFAVMTAQWQQLSDYFELSGEIDGQQWHAVLLPREAIVARSFERVELRGAELLQVIVLHEKVGDRTTIYLENTAE